MSSNDTSDAPAGPVLAPPPFVVSDDDQSGVILTVAAILMTWMALCCIIRCYLRAVVNGPFSKDDFTLIGGTVLGLAQVFVTFASISHGFGKATDLLTPQDIDGIEKTLYASDILFILANCLAKCSVALLLARLTRTRSHLLVCYIIMAVSAAWGFASVLAIALRCNVAHPWAFFQQSCPNLFLRWQVITAVDVLDEVALFATAVWLVWALQMSARLKATVIFAFGFRLPVVTAAIIRVAYLNGALSSSNPFLDLVPVAIATQVELHYSLMAATVPCMKPFVISFNTSWGTHVPRGTSYALSNMSNGHHGGGGGGSNSRSRNRSKLLGSKQRSQDDEYVPAHQVVKEASRNHSVGGGHSQTRGSAGANIGVAMSIDQKLRPEKIGHSTFVGPERRLRSDSASLETEGSQQMIIRKTEDYTVQYDNGSVI